MTTYESSIEEKSIYESFLHKLKLLQELKQQFVRSVSNFSVFSITIAYLGHSQTSMDLNISFLKEICIL